MVLVKLFGCVQLILGRVFISKIKANSFFSQVYNKVCTLAAMNCVIVDSPVLHVCLLYGEIFYVR